MNVNFPITVFYSYAYADEPLRQELEKHLSLLRRQDLISEWHYRQILAGTDWKNTLDEHLNTASLILLLISPDFLASDYCYSVEMQHALERHVQEKVSVIPILLRPVDLHKAPFAHLQCLPYNTIPITLWSNQDEAFCNVVQNIRQVIQNANSEDISSSPQAKAQVDDFQSPGLAPLMPNHKELNIKIVQRVKKGKNDIIGGRAENMENGTVVIEQEVEEAEKRVIGFEIGRIG